MRDGGDGQADYGLWGTQSGWPLAASHGWSLVMWVAAIALVCASGKAVLQGSLFVGATLPDPGKGCIGQSAMKLSASPPRVRAPAYGAASVSEC